MKYFVAALAFAAFASAQSISACGGKAQPCLDTATKNSGICDVGDWGCGCKNLEAIQGPATTCVLAACGGATGALEVLGEVQAICANLPAGSTGPTPDTPAPETPSAPETPEAPEDNSSAEVPATPTTMMTAPAYTSAPEATSTYAVVNGAGAVVPMAAAILGAAAFAL